MIIVVNIFSCFGLFDLLYTTSSIINRALLQNFKCLSLSAVDPLNFFYALENDQFEAV